jgi:Protein-arginine deiminase (PAD)
VAEFELHADYDRDGRLTASASEYAQRTLVPGAILVPNIDIDARALPAAVVPGPRLTLDGQQPVALAGDDEQLPILIRVKGPVAVGTRLFLRPVGFPKIRLRVNDGRGHILPRDLQRGDDLPIGLPAKPGDLRFTLSTHTVPGAPYGRVTDLNALYSPSGNDEASFHLQLVVVDLANQETIVDEGQFTIAPFIVLGHEATALRVYVADDGNNAATLAELEPALKGLSVPMVRVPPLPTTSDQPVVNDTWLQDQFQPAVIQGVNGWRQVMVHLPRNRADTYAAAPAANLARFVVTHFPSRNVGLLDDLWERDLQLSDVQNQRRKLSFRDCVAVAAEMDGVSRLLIRLHEALSEVARAVTDELSRDWPATFTARLSALAKLDASLRSLPPLPAKTPSDVQATRRRTVQYYRDAYDRILARYLYAGPQSPLVQVPVGKDRLVLSPKAADLLERRVVQMRSSSNYGGNIEATPPTADAQLGKLLVGNVMFKSLPAAGQPGNSNGDTWDFMDPDLLHLLVQQRKQPIVTLDTAWLEVGHVDEVLAVVPDRGGSAGFAFLRASPALGLELLTQARNRHLAGLSEPERLSLENAPSGTSLHRLMTRGQSPVTRLMRGKTWLHLHPASAPDQVPNMLEPPLLYQRLSAVLNQSDLKSAGSGGVNIQGIRYWPGPGPERHYPADITVAEVLYCEQDNRGASTNQGLAKGRSADVDQALSGQFRTVRRLPLPVIFDRVSDVSSTSIQTGAFTPNVVNMLVLGNTLLMPRPYGPRMRVEDAAVVIAEAMKAQDMPASIGQRVTAAFVKRHGLGQAVYWIERQKRLDRPLELGGPATVGEATTALYDGLVTKKDVIAQFEDSFPGADDEELDKRIIQPNKQEFDALGELKNGPRRLVIDDGWVDLFEAATLAVADELGLAVIWVDSWFYHLRHGEIHCGTNVLRAPPTRVKTPVWSVPDTTQGPNGRGIQTFDFTKTS